MVDHYQERMPNGNCCLLASPANDESLILGREVRILTVDGSMSSLHQGRTEPWAAFARLSVQTFAPTFVVAWAHPCPRSQMSRIGKTAHVWSNLGQDHFRQTPLDPWDCRESLDLVFIGTQALSNLCAHALNGFIKRGDVTELLSDQKAMMRFELPLQGLR